MNLAEIRKWFIADSGRNDLVNDDGSDNGANKYINAGQQFLDRLGVVQKRLAKSYYRLRPGQRDIVVKAARALEHVTVVYDGSRILLDKKTEAEVLAQFPSLSVGSGAPNAYAIFNNRMLDKTWTYEMPIESNIPQASYGNDSNSIGIMLLPAPDRTCVLEVIGVFYSNPLVKDSDQSFWSIRHPEVLVKAALFELETFFRNTEGASDWLNAVNADVTRIEMDVVEEESAGIKQMWG